MHGMELDIVDRGGVLGEDACRVDGLTVEAKVPLQVPEADVLVFGAGDQLAFGEGVPFQGEAFGLVTFESGLWFADELVLGNRWVLRTVPDVEVVICCPRSDDVGVLRLVACLVDLTRMDNLLHDGESDLLLRCAMAAQLFVLGVVVCKRGCGWLWQLDVGDLEVFGSILGGMGAKEEAMRAEGFPWDVFHVGQPLRGERGPVEGTAVIDMSHVDEARMACGAYLYMTS